MPYRSLTSTALFAIFAVTSNCNAAYALDGQDLLKRFNVAAAQSGITYTAGSIESDGDAIHLKNLAFARLENPDTKFELGDLTLQNVQQRADGAYTIGRIDAPDITHLEGKTKIVAEGISIENCQIAPLPKGTTVDTLSFCEAVETGAVKVLSDGKEIASIDSITYEISRLPDNSGLVFEAAVAGIYLNFADAPNVDATSNASLKSVGLEQVNANFESKGSWTLADGRMKLDDNRLTIGDVGTLGFGFDISGYTLETVYAVADKTAALAKAKGSSVEEEDLPTLALQEAMLEMAAKVSLNNVFIRFEDDGLTAKLLDSFATAQGTSPSEFSQAIKLTLDAQVSQIEPWLGAEFAKSFKVAINDYLDDPESLIVAARPISPVPFMTFASANLAEPKTLIQLLALEIKANQ